MQRSVDFAKSVSRLICQRRVRVTGLRRSRELLKAAPSRWCCCPSMRPSRTMDVNERAEVVTKLTRCEPRLLCKTSKLSIPSGQLIGRISPMVLRKVTPNPQSRFRSRTHGHWPGGIFGFEKRAAIAKILRTPDKQC